MSEYTDVIINIKKHFPKLDAVLGQQGIEFARDVLPSKFKEANDKGVKLVLDFENISMSASFFNYALAGFMKQNNISSEHAMNVIRFQPENDTLRIFYEIGMQTMERAHDKPTVKEVITNEASYSMRVNVEKNHISYEVHPHYEEVEPTLNLAKMGILLNEFIENAIIETDGKYKIGDRDFKTMDDAITSVAINLRLIETNEDSIKLGGDFEKQIKSHFTETQEVARKQKNKTDTRLKNEKNEKNKESKDKKATKNGVVKKLSNFFDRG